MKLMMINNKILNFDHVVEVNLGSHELTIEKLASKMTIIVGNENIGLTLIPKEFEELKKYLKDQCCYCFGSSIEAIKEEKVPSFGERLRSIVEETTFDRPPDSIINRSEISDDHIDKIAQSLPPVEKPKKKRVRKVKN